MNTNAIADELLKFLELKHSRVYRNKRPQKPIFPYVVYRLSTSLNTHPSEDVYVNIDIYDDINEPVRNMEDLADTIDNDLNLKVIDTEVLNLHFDREQRQYVSPEELVSMHLINLRYVVRSYFK